MIVRRGSTYRGMGQTPCSWFQSWLCGSSSVEAVMGRPCSECNQITAPSLAANAGGPALPVGYDPNTGEIDPSNTTGQTGIYPYAPTYPANVAPNSGAGVACDWTQASWLDFTTWCSANWMMAGVVGLGVVLLLRRGK